MDASSDYNGSAPIARSRSSSVSSSEEVFQDAIDPSTVSQKKDTLSSETALEPTGILHNFKEIDHQSLHGTQEETKYENDSECDSETQIEGKRIRIPNLVRNKYANFIKTMEFLNDEFRDDLAVHLYTVYVLHTQNPFYPDYRFCGWPLPPDIVPAPQGDHIGYPPKSRYTKFASLKNKSGMKPPFPHMLEKFRYRVDPRRALNQVIDTIYERKIIRKIRNYNMELGKSGGQKLVARPTLEYPIKLPSSLKAHLTDKLNDIVDKLLIRQKIRAKAVNDTGMFGPELNPNLDWHDVSVNLEKMSEPDHLRKLFSVYMDRDFYRSKNISRHKFRHLKMFGESLSLLHNVEETLEVIRSEVKGKKRKLDAFDEYIEEVVDKDIPVWTKSDRMKEENRKNKDAKQV